MAKAEALAEGIATIHVVALIGDLDKIEGPRFHPDIEGVGAAGRLPLHIHFPAVEVAPEAHRRIGKSVANKIIAKVTYADRPVLGELDLPAAVDGIGRNHELGLLIAPHPIEGDIMGYGEILEQTEEILLLPVGV